MLLKREKSTKIIIANRRCFRKRFLKFFRFSIRTICATIKKRKVDAKAASGKAGNAMLLLLGGGLLIILFAVIVAVVSSVVSAVAAVESDSDE